MAFSKKQLHALAEVQLCILAYLVIPALSESGSPIIGDTDQTPNFLVITTDDPDGLYLNTDRPATCNGTISLLQYCYYGHIDILQNTYRSLIAVYRPVNQSHYVRVSETISVTRRSYPLRLTSQGDDFLPGFNCDSQRLSPSVKVLAGDIVGICIYNSRGTSELDMITFRSGGYRMMFEGAGSVRCDTGEMPRVVGDRLQLDSARRTLHISAEIVPDLVSTISPIVTTEFTSSTDDSEAETGEPGRTSITTGTVAIIIGGVMAIALITLTIIIIIVVTCRFVVCSRKKKNGNQGNRNALFDLTSNAAYHNWNGERLNDETSGENSLESSPTAVYDYIIINDGSAPTGPRGNNKHNRLKIALRSDSGFIVQKNVAYHQ